MRSNTSTKVAVRRPKRRAKTLEFHEKIRFRRLEKGLDQTEAATRAGVRKSTWNGWEHGVEPYAKAAVRVAKVLDTTAEDLFGDDPAPAPPPVTPAPMPSGVVVVRDPDFDQRPTTEEV